MPTPPILKNLPIRLQPDGRRAVLFDAAASPASASSVTTFRAIGYRQTNESAARGGRANHNGFRIRNGAMRALGRSGRGRAFITGHDWGDVRARGGTIRDSYAEPLGDAEMAIVCEIEAQAAWAIEGLANGTIDRFSFGVMPSGEITCTVHDAPVWSIDECWCFPCETVALDDGREVVAEWEYEDGEMVELSAVNVPAVEGTGIIAAAGELVAPDHPRAFLAARLDHMRELAALCGRQHPAIAQLAQGGGLAGGFPRRSRPTTMAACTTAARNSDVTHEQLCQMLGLPVTATADEVRARISANAAQAAESGALRAEVLAAHVNAEIGRLRASRVVPEDVVAELRAAANGDNARTAFDAAIKLVEKTAPAIEPARPALQSDARPALATGPATAKLAEGPDAFEANAANPELGRMMRVAKVTEAEVRKHGARTFSTLANLRELETATLEREATETARRTRGELR